MSNMRKVTITLAMIVKDEEDTLGNCLESVKGLFDEIVIVDTGSADSTRELALKYTDRVYDFTWIDDFAAARNYAFSLATGDYVMWLDADDVILGEDRQKLKKLLNGLDGKVLEVAALYNVGFDENGRVTFRYYRERIFLRSAGFKWMGRVHETIALLPDCLYSDFAVTHRKLHATERGRNLRILEKMKEGGELDERGVFYYARELFYNGRTADAERQFERFLDMSRGYVENKIDACRLLSNCKRLLKKPWLPPLLRSLEYDAPRAEICCDIGGYFLERGQNEISAYWYEQALAAKPPEKSGGFTTVDCYGYLPLLQLCVLYYRMGQTEKAEACNERAALIKPDDAAVEYNRKFFKSLKERPAQGQSPPQINNGIVS